MDVIMRVQYSLLTIVLTLLLASCFVYLNTREVSIAMRPDDAVNAGIPLPYGVSYGKLVRIVSRGWPFTYIRRYEFWGSITKMEYKYLLIDIFICGLFLVLAGVVTEALFRRSTDMKNER